MMTCNVLSPQIFWFKSLRENIVVSFVIAVVVNIGMWFERFVIIVTSLHRDYLPSSWTYFTPRMADIGDYMFSFGLFSTLFFLFSKFLPVINMAEVKSVLKTSSEKPAKH
jgi:molybdopterin-containing oxidoreductase family membrane subunit